MYACALESSHQLQLCNWRKLPYGRGKIKLISEIFSPRE